MKLRGLRAACAFMALASTGLAQAEIIGGVNFPSGASSFADAVVSYTVGTGGVTAPFQGGFNALGVPDYTGANGCASQAACSFVSLGSGGSIVLRFTDNLLTGSNSAALDLWVFEIGPDVEDTFVDVSTDGVTWTSVGKVFGGTKGIDLDSFGFGIGSTFGYVRLTDDPNEGARTGATAGADIDAVGAISSVPNNVDAPPTLALAALALLALAGGRRRQPKASA